MVAQAAALRVKPSPATVRAATNAANHPHGLINLIRLVKSLDTASLELGLDEVDEYVDREKVAVQVKKDEQTAAYAQVMLEALKESNEGSSSTASTLDDLQKTLLEVEDRYAQVLAPKIQTIPLSKTLSRVSATSSKGTHARANGTSTPVTARHTPAISVEAPQPPAPPAQVVRKRKNPPLAVYLQTRSKEDKPGSEEGLLSLRIKPMQAEKSNRDLLLGSDAVGMGAAQVHEELGGQLADMSHRLKLNAVHFSNSLEAEKAILETSQHTLENNLTATLSSKRNLSAVSKKSRGTTCMTLGIVLLVLIIFVWTYMLIRFT